jgi:hypothetical protein
MSHPPLNLSARDFDAYAAEKATSNVYSRPRIEVKQRALAWARGVVARLAELGIAVDVHGSDEHPTLRNRKRVDCQWVFFWRDQAARDELDRLLDQGRSIAAEIDDPSPYTRHAFLALRLDAATVEVCFAVHPEAQVDVENLRARLDPPGGDDAPAAALIAALRALPEQFAIGISPDDRQATSAVTPEALRALIDSAAAGQVPLWIGWSVTRDTAIEHSAILDEQLEDAIVALAPLYRLVAWSRENDRIALDRRIESAEQERARAHAHAEAQTERWRTEQAEARRNAAELARSRALAQEAVNDGAPGRDPRPRSRPPADPARRPSLDTLFSPKAAPKVSPSTAPSPTPPVVAPAAPPPAPPSDNAPPQPQTAGHDGGYPQTPGHDGGNPQTPGDRNTPPMPPPAPPAIEKGVKVRVLSGAFADKVGVIGELDGRGGARVLLGLLSTRLDVADLEPIAEGRERPALQSSHRRPQAPAPRKAR